MKLEDRYMYTVVPRTPIRNIIKGKAITKATNLQLSKEEVKACLKYGAVYRKFYCESNPERVTTANLERLHRKEHLSEREYEALISKTNSESEDEDFLKNGEEEQLPTDKLEESVPQNSDDVDKDENSDAETGDDDPVDEATTESKEDTSNTEIVFDTEGDFLKKEDEEQSYTGDENSDAETGDDDPVDEATTEQPTQRQVANANNQRNNNSKRKNKNKQRNQSEEK
ncbi:MAG: hypothetical protein NC548_15450 [Lachnospiraceae bacterium]|nr:hypothetical protein [Lachnospiraceae bacterium]